MQDFNLAKIVPYYRFQGKRFEESGLDVQSSKFKVKKTEKSKRVRGQGSGVGYLTSEIRGRISAKKRLRILDRINTIDRISMDWPEASPCRRHRLKAKARIFYCEAVDNFLSCRPGRTKFHLLILLLILLILSKKSLSL
jgi:hypothetical protein